MRIEPDGEDGASDTDARRRMPIRPLFVAAILSGSFLLFLVQPMIARMALPRLGGAPAVWNSAMLVYQALLLGGYGYAHWLGRFAVRRQAAIHLAVLVVAALWLPIGLIDMTPAPGDEPALWVPWLLFASIGPLFLAVSAQAPLLQRWFAEAAEGVNPYALYAASNIGSFAGLIAYPLLVEPNMALSSQRWLWTAGYVLLILLVAACAVGLPRLAQRRSILPVSPAPGVRRVVHWIALALVPSGLMLATSTFLTTDIVAVPLLWVLPLGLYLLSFSVAFAAGRRVADFLTTFAPVTILVFGGAMIGGAHEYAFLNAAIALLLLFMVSVALHTALYRTRPQPDRLTGFYLAMSVGGALGGVFAGLIAPVLFDWTYEYPMLILAAGLLAPQGWLLPVLPRLWETHRGVTLGAVAAVAVAIMLVGIENPSNLLGPRHEAVAYSTLIVLGILAIGARPAFGVTLAASLLLFGGWRAIQITLEGDSRTRSYFGVYTVRDYPAEGTRTLAHGTTLHGVQFVDDPVKAREPTSYYVPGSGIGRAMATLPGLYGDGARVGAVGLGTGTLACYAQPGQDWRFYEIDPVVVGIARDSGKFGFLRRCLPDARIVMGDARLSIAAQPANSLDLLALDAFSSDAVPLHLMTREALAQYARVLGRSGLLLVHISNRFLDLEPVVAATAKGGGWYSAALHYAPGPADNSEATMSDWIAMTRDPETFATLMIMGGDWVPLRRRRDLSPWTDDYASIVPVLADPLAEVGE
jgi:spermidine synthase